MTKLFKFLLFFLLIPSNIYAKNIEKIVLADSGDKFLNEVVKEVGERIFPKY